jgi:sodium/hydrogen antiporter
MSSSTSHSRAPVAAAVFCLAVGMLAGVWDAQLGARALEHARSAQVLAEAALVICLFCTGLRIARPLELEAWRVPLRLALVTLPVTVALVAGAANVFLGLPMPEALLLAAILAPTDPVLAFDLRVSSADREDAVRFALGAEGALSSSLALPVVLFALGLTGHHDLGPLALRWAVLDVAWALAAGAALGWLLGALAAYALARLDSRSGAGQLGLTELALLASLLAFTYGASMLAHANGFVAVLAAGLAVALGGAPWPGSVVRWPRTGAVAGRARALTSAAARVERFAELALVIVLGALLTGAKIRPGLILFALVALVAIRPLAARLALGTARDQQLERQLIAWFGIRGVASLYYLMFAVGNGLSTPLAAELTAISLGVLATSIALHGLTALPLGGTPAGQQNSGSRLQ